MVETLVRIGISPPEKPVPLAHTIVIVLDTVVAPKSVMAAAVAVAEQPLHQGILPMKLDFIIPPLARAMAESHWCCVLGRE